MAARPAILPQWRPPQSEQRIGSNGDTPAECVETAARHARVIELMNAGWTQDAVAAEDVVPDETSDRPTNWEIRSQGYGHSAFSSRDGRIFKVGDRLNMPPPFPYGRVWRVIAVEESAVEGYLGLLVVEPDDD